MTLLPEHLRTRLPVPRKICYVGDISPGSTMLYRVQALERLGQHVDVFNLTSYRPKSSLLAKLRFRYPVTPLIYNLNRDLIQRAMEIRPDIVILDKPIYITRHTILELKELGAKVVFYVQDAPFGPRNDGCWKQFLKTYPLADLHCTVRKADSARYKQWGLPYVELMFSYAPEVLSPPPDAWSDKERDRDIAYIGHPHENRPEFLARLATEYHLPVSISGNGWDGIYPDELAGRLLRDRFLVGPEYCKAIWKSKVNLSFVTQRNEDDIAHKSVEIAASGGFLLALKTEGHSACFEEDREAVFYSTINECAEKAAYYLAHEKERAEIAHRGYLRAIENGYSNDTQLSHLLNYFD